MSGREENSLSKRLSNMKEALERAVRKPSLDTNIYMIGIAAAIIAGIAIWALNSFKPEWIRTAEGGYSWVKVGGIVLTSILASYFGAKMYESY